jgi:predicted GNAT family acetyltransferase
MPATETPDPAIHVQHEPERSRYSATVDGAQAVAEYRRDGNVTAFVHTEVPSRIAGRGVASALARRALDDARAEGQRVIPACDFFAHYMKEHPEYDDLRAATSSAD